MEGYENHKWFEITDEAKNQIEKLLEKNPGKYAVSLAVLGGGCAGFKYDWGFADSKESVSEGDHVEDWHTGRFVVDETSMKYFPYRKTQRAGRGLRLQCNIQRSSNAVRSHCGRESKHVRRTGHVAQQWQGVTTDTWYPRHQ